MPTLDEIDAVWILKDMARRNAAEPALVTSIRVSLYAKVETATGQATVSRDVDLTPQEVLSVLRARTIVPH